MISKFVTFLLILMILPIGFFFSSPAYADSLDYCIEILQEEASIVVDGIEKFKLKQYPEFAEIAKHCNKDLRNAGLITLSQVKNKRVIAEGVLNGILVEEDLDETVRKRKEADLKQKEENLKTIRQDICSKKDKKNDFACESQ